MNNRQRKKQRRIKDKVIVVVKCEMRFKETDFEKIKRGIEADFEKKNMIVLPAGFNVATVITCSNNNEIRIETEKVNI